MNKSGGPHNMLNLVYVDDTLKYLNQEPGGQDPNGPNSPLGDQNYYIPTGYAQIVIYNFPKQKKSKIRARSAQDSQKTGDGRFSFYLSVTPGLVSASFTSYGPTELGDNPSGLLGTLDLTPVVGEDDED